MKEGLFDEAAAGRRQDFSIDREPLFEVLAGGGEFVLCGWTAGPGSEVAEQAGKLRGGFVHGAAKAAIDLGRGDGLSELSIAPLHFALSDVPGEHGDLFRRAAGAGGIFQRCADVVHVMGDGELLGVVREA